MGSQNQKNRLGCHKSQYPSGNCVRAFNFIPCVNNFSEALSTNFDVLQFADDTATLCLVRNEATLQLQADNALNKTDQ